MEYDIEKVRLVLKGDWGTLSKEGISEQEARQRIEEIALEGLISMIPFYLNLLSLKTDDPKFNCLDP